MTKKKTKKEETPPEPITVDTQCCRTCAHCWSRPRTSSTFVCTHKDQRIYVDGAGYSNKTVKPTGGQGCEDFKRNPYLKAGK